MNSSWNSHHKQDIPRLANVDDCFFITDNGMSAKRANREYAHWKCKNVRTAHSHGTRSPHLVEMRTIKQKTGYFIDSRNGLVSLWINPDKFPCPHEPEPNPMRCAVKLGIMIQSRIQLVFSLFKTTIRSVNCARFTSLDKDQILSIRAQWVNFARISNQLLRQTELTERRDQNTWKALSGVWSESTVNTTIHVWFMLIVMNRFIIDSLLCWNEEPSLTWLDKARLI
jgi:hypothetical protein